MNESLQGKVAVITGAAGGIGTALVRTFVREGAKVVIHYRSSETQAHKLAAEFPNECVAIRADLTSEKEVAHLFAEAEKTVGIPNVLVANAGTYVEKDTPIVDMALEQWNTTFQNNTVSIFLTVREFLRGIRKSKETHPSIILIGSTAGIYGEALHADYAASKSAATYGFMRTLKNELPHIAPRGRVNAICPSWVLTPMADSFVAHPEAVVRALQTVPLRKVGRPEDVAESAAFLASEKRSGHMSGQLLELAGGMEGRTLYAPEQIDVSKA